MPYSGGRKAAELVRWVACASLQQKTMSGGETAREEKSSWTTMTSRRTLTLSMQTIRSPGRNPLKSGRGFSLPIDGTPQELFRFRAPPIVLRWSMHLLGRQIFRDRAPPRKCIAVSLAARKFRRRLRSADLSERCHRRHDIRPPCTLSRRSAGVSVLSEKAGQIFRAGYGKSQSSDGKFAM